MTKTILRQQIEKLEQRMPPYKHDKKTFNLACGINTRKIKKIVKEISTKFDSLDGFFSIPSRSFAMQVCENVLYEKLKTGDPKEVRAALLAICYVQHKVAEAQK